MPAHDDSQGILLSAAACARADRHTMDTLGIPSLLLMERAALAVSLEIRERFAEGRDVIVLCGPGNNGGDGLAVARQLCGWGIRARAILCTARRNETVTEQLGLARALGVGILEELPAQAAGPATIVVDALLGTGARGAPRGPIESALRWFLQASGPRVAIDVPTGVDPDTGATPGVVAQVDLTVTMQRSKPGLHITPGRDLSGLIVIADIGLVEEPDSGGTGTDTPARLVSPWAVAELTHGASAGHKGERGHVGVIGGSRGTTGAAILAGVAAMRCGAGLVTITELEAGLGDVMISGRPELMIEPVRDGALGDLPLPRADVLIVGPGLTRAQDRCQLRRLWAEDPRPAIWDASALEELQVAARGRAPPPRIITPHPGEARRLLGRLGGPAERGLDLRADRREAARALARLTGAIVVLKGAGTLIDDGARLAIAVSGGPGLATAGSGDCLTGFVAALVGLGNDLFRAACAGVHLHGLAGELAVAERPGALALDIAELAGAAKAAPPGHPRWPKRRLA